MKCCKISMLFAAGLAVLCLAQAQALTFTFTEVAKPGDVPTGSPGGLRNLFSDPGVDSFGNVVFSGFTTNASGIGYTKTAVAFINGELKQIHREGSLLPGTGITEDNLDDHVEIQNGLVALTGDAADADGIDYIAISDGTTSRVVALAGVTVLPSTNSPVITFIPNSEGFGFDGTRLAFRASFTNDGRGIYLDDGFGGITKIADTTDTTPGGDPFTSFNNAMPDAHGPGIVFFGSTTNGNGIFLSLSGGLTNIADYADYPPVSTNVDFVGIGEPDIDNGQIVFNTRQQDFGFPNGSPERTPAASVEFYDGTSVTTIVNQSTLLPTGTTSVDFAEAAIHNGTIAFAAQDNTSGSGQTAVFIWREGVLYKVVALGDTVDGRVVSGIGTYNRPFLADGFLALELLFADGSAGVFRVNIVEPPVVPVLHWNLEEATGTNTGERISGETNVAQLVGALAWTNGLAPGSGAAVNFRDTTPDSYIDAGTLDTNGVYGADTTNINGKVITSQWTISAWVQVPDQPAFGDRCIITSDTTGGQDWWLFFIRGIGDRDHGLGFDFKSTRFDSPLDIPPGKPVFVSISGDQSGTLFENGSRSRFAMWDGATWRYHETNLYVNIRLDGLEIGSFNDGTREFVGDIDDVRIYSNALSRAELAGLALSGEIGGPLSGSIVAPDIADTPTGVTFQVQFSEDVTGFDASDISFSGSGTLTSSVPVITGTGSHYAVSVPITGEGTLNIDLVPGIGVQTLDGGPLVYHYPASILVDFTPPYVTGLFYAGRTNNNVYLAVQFSEIVNGDAQMILEDVDSRFSSLNGGGIFVSNQSNASASVYVRIIDGFTGGVFRTSVDLSSASITDVVGLPLMTPNPTTDVFVSATAYQLWAIDKGLTPNTNFAYWQNPDGDTRINGYEFVRDGNPLVPFDPIKRAVHIADVNGTNYLALTMAAPDDVVYETFGPNNLYANYCTLADFCMGEEIWASDDIRDIVFGNLGLIEDPGITPPPGLPALSPGYSYRHFRMTDPVDTLPTGFIMNDLYDDD